MVKDKMGKFQEEQFLQEDLIEQSKVSSYKQFLKTNWISEVPKLSWKI